MDYTELLCEVEGLVLDDQPHLSGDRDILPTLHQFDAFHTEPPQSYLGYRYRLRVALDSPDDRPLSPAEILRFISMTVDDGKSLGRYLSKKYGPFDAPGFDAKKPYVDEGSSLLSELESPIVDLMEAGEKVLDHLENMTAILLAGEEPNIPVMHGELVKLAIARLAANGAAADRVATTHELLGSLLADRAQNPARALETIRVQFAGLREGLFDFLLPFEDSLRHTTIDLAQERIDFEVLPPGTDLCAHVPRAYRRSRPANSAIRVAPEKLRVLDELRSYFGRERCQTLRGTASSRRFLGQSESNINGSYLVLVIACIDRDGRHTGDDAIAISPLTGHATFYVRHDATEYPWREIFSYPKRDAKVMGARPLHLAGPAGRDPAIALRERLVALAQCSPQQFHTGRLVPVPGTRRYTIS